MAIKKTTTTDPELATEPFLRREGRKWVATRPDTDEPKGVGSSQEEAYADLYRQERGKIATPTPQQSARSLAAKNTMGALGAIPPRAARATAKAPKAQSTTFVLPPLNLETIEPVIIGDSPLIVHAWSEKAKKLMLQKQTKEAQSGKEAKNPVEDFQQSMYTIEGGGYGFPSVGIKAAMVTAVTSISGVTKVAARQAFRVVGEQALVRGAHPGLVMRQDLVRILGSEPEMREDMVRVGMGTADIRYRAQFLPWCIKLRISYNANLLSGGQLVNLLNVAGFGVGIGEWRQERDGQSGAFHVADRGEVEHLIEKGVLNYGESTELRVGGSNQTVRAGSVRSGESGRRVRKARQAG